MLTCDALTASLAHSTVARGLETSSVKHDFLDNEAAKHFQGLRIGSTSPTFCIQDPKRSASSNMHPIYLGASASASSSHLLKEEEALGTCQTGQEDRNHAQQMPKQSHSRCCAYRYLCSWSVIHVCLIVSYTTLCFVALSRLLSSRPNAADCHCKQSEFAPADVLLCLK